MHTYTMTKGSSPVPSRRKEIYASLRAFAKMDFRAFAMGSIQEAGECECDLEKEPQVSTGEGGSVNTVWFPVFSSVLHYV